jgi:HD-like signal output (HDOD) protein
LLQDHSKFNPDLHLGGLTHDTLLPAIIMTARELVAGVTDLLSFSTVYFRVNELLQDPRSSAQDLGVVISHEPGLATRLLKIVNSAYYGFPGKIDTLSRAVTIVGIRELEALVLATVAVDAFNRISTELVDMSTFWHHSVYCGLVARLLAGRCGVLHTERLFVAGLLHDVGQLVIYHQIPEQARQALAAAEPSDNGLYRAEQDLLGFTHGDVAAELFEIWGLPASIKEAAAFHHEPGRAKEFPLETALVHLANSAANSVEPGRNILDCRPMRDAQAWQSTGLSEDDLERALADAKDQFLDVIRIISPSEPLL